MMERTLFPDDDPGKVPPKTPHNNTPTSRIAAKLAERFAASQQEQVFQFIEQAGEHGATDQEIESTLGIAGNSVRPRRRKLVELGRVKESGNLRLTLSHSPASVWIVTPPKERQSVTSKSNWPTGDKANPTKSVAAEFVPDFAI